MIERYDGSAKIFVLENQDLDTKQNRYWQRFIAVKEACHIAIDGHEDWQADGVVTVEELINDLRSESSGAPIYEVQSEYLAEIVAIELLYPFEFRQVDLESGKAASELADEYQVPTYVVELALSSSHIKLAEVFWAVVGGYGRPGIGGAPIQGKTV
ncbi:MAG: hypothetical protein Rhims3KO_05870 [Hyphomicrobiales bacterium]